jgi:drug/metabolite transporter (DMT)-like permease
MARMLARRLATIRRDGIRTGVTASERHTASDGAARPSPSAVAAPRSSPVLDLVAASALWGGMYVVSAATFDAIPPVTLAVLRILVGCGVLLLVFHGRIGLGQAPARRVVVAGAIVALTLVLQFVGTDLTGAAEGAILTTTTPAFVLLFGVVLEGQRVRRVAWAGVAVALAGVAVLAARNGSFAAAGGPSIAGVPAPLIGDALLVASAATWALFSSVGRPLVDAVGAFRAILQASLVAAVLLLPFASVELAGRGLPPLDAAAIGAVLYLGIGATALAWSLWYRGYARTPATVSAAAFFAQPVVGAALGALLLREALGPEFLVGAVLIGVGVLAIVAGGRERRAQS